MKPSSFWYMRNIIYALLIPDRRRNNYTIKRNSYNPVRERKGDSPKAADEGRGDYQERAAADSGDETES